jgi:hypothetical protein
VEYNIQHFKNLLYGVSISLALDRECSTNGEKRLRVFENRVLRRIFRPKRDEMTGVWRKLHNEELHNSYSSLTVIKMIKSRRMGRASTTNGETRNAYRILVEKPEGKRPLGRPRRRWVDNIKMDLGDTG